MKRINILISLLSCLLYGTNFAMEVNREPEASKEEIQEDLDATELLSDFLELKTIINLSKDCEEELIQALINSGAVQHPTNPTQEKPSLNPFKKIKKLIKKPDTKTSKAKLHQALSLFLTDYLLLDVELSKKCEKELIEVLIKNGVDPNFTNPKSRRGTTALQIATDNKKFNAVQTLLENNADPNKKNNIGNTALIYAVNPEAFDILQFLIEHGANPTIKGSQGRTPLEQAQHKLQNFNLTPQEKEEMLQIIGQLELAEKAWREGIFEKQK